MIESSIIWHHYIFKVNIKVQISKLQRWNYSPKKVRGHWGAGLNSVLYKKGEGIYVCKTCIVHERDVKGHVGWLGVTAGLDKVRTRGVRFVNAPYVASTIDSYSIQINSRCFSKSYNSTPNQKSVFCLICTSYFY